MQLELTFPMFRWCKPPFCQSNAHFRWRSPDFPISAAYTICFLGNPLFIGISRFPHLFPLKNIFIERFRRARWRLVSGKGHGGFAAKRHSRDASKNGDFPWADWCHWWSMTFFQKNMWFHWWSMTFFQFKICIWKHGEHGDLVWHFSQRCDESISFWTCPWYVFTFLIAHSISHIRWQWISMDALIHVFHCLSRFVPSCGVYSQVFSIATPAYFLAKLTIPLGKLSILCGFTPFFWRWTPHFNWWHRNFSWWNLQFLGLLPSPLVHLSTLSRLRWGLLEDQWAKLRLVRNGPETYWQNHGEMGWVRDITKICFKHDFFFSSHHMGWSEKWATPQNHTSTANHDVSPKHRYVVAIISPIPSPMACSTLPRMGFH